MSEECVVGSKLVYLNIYKKNGGTYLQEYMIHTPKPSQMPCGICVYSYLALVSHQRRLLFMIK